MPPEFASGNSPVIPLTLLSDDELAAWFKGASDWNRRWVEANGFAARPDELVILPDKSGSVAGVLAGRPVERAGTGVRFHLASVMQRLPTGNYRLSNDLGPEDRDESALAALLSQYRPGAGRDTQEGGALLVAPEGSNPERLRMIAECEFMIRDMINAPASSMTPDRLEEHIRSLAEEQSAEFRVVRGKELADQCPLTFAVGRSSEHEPRLLELNWGSSGPLVTLIGKGVCFDTGGLNMKPGRAMALMKKDMAGAAVTAGLSRAIMRLGLPIRLRALIPVAENSVSGRSVRPGDVLRSKSGVGVEITNTDAEGRLLLADALGLAGESESDLTISFATLTGAARVALGPQVVPFYTACDHLAGVLTEAGRKVRDPLWRMPLWEPYEAMLKSDLADLANSPSSGFAGSIVAALFLHRFAGQPEKFVHFDVYCWQGESAPGIPKGGCGQAGRAVLEAIQETMC